MLALLTVFVFAPVVIGIWLYVFVFRNTQSTESVRAEEEVRRKKEYRQGEVQHYRERLNEAEEELKKIKIQVHELEEQQEQMNAEQYAREMGDLKAKLFTAQRDLSNFQHLFEEALDRLEYGPW